MRGELSRSVGKSREIHDLADHSKWSLSDLAQFRIVMEQLEKSVTKIKSRREEQSQSLRELEGLMLKGTILTRCREN
jgi:hypothetical protein